MSCTTSAPAGAAASSSAARARTSGWTIASSAARRAGVGEHERAQRRPGRARRRRSSTSGPNSATTAARPGVPGATTSRASSVGVDHHRPQLAQHRRRPCSCPRRPRRSVPRAWRHEPYARRSFARSEPCTMLGCPCTSLLSPALTHIERDPFVSPIRNKSLTAAAIGSTVLAVSMLGLPSQAATGGSAPPGRPCVEVTATARTPGYLRRPSAQRHRPGRGRPRQVNGRTTADRLYFRSLGSQAVVDIDPLTHTPRDLGGSTATSPGAPRPRPAPSRCATCASHLSALGLHQGRPEDLPVPPGLRRPIGVHNLSWTQSVRGATVFGNGLKVRVTRDGRVLAVQGSPVSGLARLAAAAPTATERRPPRPVPTAARNVGTARPARATVDGEPRRLLADDRLVQPRLRQARLVPDPAAACGPAGRRTSRPRPAPTST